MFLSNTERRCGNTVKGICRRNTADDKVSSVGGLLLD